MKLIESNIAGQRQMVGQLNRMTTAASVIEPIAWPLGKLKVVSGAIDSHRLGRSRWKSCLAERFSSAEPTNATAANVPSRQRRAASSASTISVSIGITPYW
ncbi:hypothetical protein D3C86_1834370 [compost metagenome]